VTAPEPVSGGTPAAARRPRKVPPLEDWEVWSCTEGLREFVVDQGPREHCEQGADRRNEAAERLGIKTLFVARRTGTTGTGHWREAEAATDA